MAKPSTFAARLRILLDEKHLTQSDLARVSGVSKSAISHYLKGDFEGKQDVVYRIAQVTNVQEAWLMGYDVPMDRPALVTEQLYALTPDEWQRTLRIRSAPSAIVSAIDKLLE